MRLVVVLDVAARPARARARGGSGALGRRVVALDVPRRPPRRAGRPVGLDDPGAVDRAAALRRDALAPRRRLPERRAPTNAPRRSRCSSLWANLHGSVVLGAGLTVLLAGATLVRDRGARPLLPVALLVAAPLCVLATPYGWDIVAYYDLMLVDAPFADILREWQWSKPERRRRRCSGCSRWWPSVSSRSARCRRRLTLFELLVLAVTLVGAVQAVRGVIWFALACAAILPVALDGLLTRADPSCPARQPRDLGREPRRPRRRAPRRARPATAAGSSRSGPSEQVAAVREATRDPSTRLLATDGTADWLLWRIPDLRGRIAYDVRFELYDPATLDRISAYGQRRRRGVEVARRRLRRRDRRRARPPAGVPRGARRASGLPRRRDRGRRST